ncbi:30S ribosomal protein S7 [Candidatus Woesearchaeota archaeon]|nr:30S ribosomal protein S7 [Candidatus Woesearchaeota archaeon]
MTEILAFNRWSTNGIIVKDPGLARYINLDPKIVPKTNARWIGRQFHKSKTFIVERLINRIRVTGHKSKQHHFKTSGHMATQGINAYNIIEKVFLRIEKQTKENPIKVFVKAIENAAPREEIVTIEYGGARYPKAVDSSPQRRIDLVLKLISQGSYHKSFNSKKSIVDTLSEEIVNAYNSSPNSAVIAKKNELERQADSSR